MKTQIKQDSLSITKLAQIQKSTFGYFLEETNPANGMVPDSTRENSPASIAAIAFALTSYPIGVERGYMTRAEAIHRILSTLRFFQASEQSTSPNATGYKGFYYHFLDMKSGSRAIGSEVSTIDSAFLFAGMLTVAMYFDRDTAAEREIRALSAALYARANWRWAQNGKLKVSHGWKPEEGFLENVWEGYSEALILTPSDWPRQSFPYPPQATRHGRVATNGKRFVVWSFFTRDRCSSINSPMSGSIFAEFRMSSCARKASLILKTAAARLTSSKSTPCAIRTSLPVTVNTVGE